ncbi:hypothetical protein AJ79_00915 [Helicocarpus griseus UAMH5409]|uniref:CID domain-containing protein n=1 Tax=Helicocarpus griseus UAMH5409 TaxID=1447875 RepID=A0A2B7Y130_9EURO|nr:hypothetical protein AJ79_00915 [Helicocarpus griseus UAMH5409]
MPEDSKVKGFPDLSSKLSAPARKSQFERQKAEAEAKRAREKAETEAVYEDFVKSFENDADASPRPSAGGRMGAFGHGSSVQTLGSIGPSKRHFTSSSMRAGPVNLGGSHSFGSRKRPFEVLQPSHKDRDSGHGLFAFDNSPSTHVDTAAAFQTSDDEEDKLADKKEAERAAAKPTLHLSSLPPGTSPAVVKALVSHALVVDGVKILQTPSQGAGERRIWSAIVTLAKETAATEMDTVVSSLQNKYLGWGYYLSISRHLSSAAINSTMPVVSGSASSTSQPFGARPINQGPGSHFGRGGPAHRGGFAPPSSYGPGYGGRGASTLQVEVKPPSDLKQLKLIHKTLENLLTYGPEFEALLMSRTEVQKDEKWAWIWDSRSPGGVWYRWKLWDILTGARRTRERHSRMRPAPTSVFESGPAWVPPEKHLQFEYVTRMDEFVSDDDYDSSDEDDSDREDERRLDGGPADSNSDGIGHLNPLQKAKLAHLLAKLPTSNSKLRRGDVARVTSFAISHAGRGADEVVDMIVSNVASPFAFTSANPERQRRETELRGGKPEEGDEANSGEQENQTTQPSSKPSSKENLDTSAAKLVGLYVISDILSSSSTSGVRHAWRYRQLFESALKTHKIFEHLGRLEKELGWGRLKIEKWRRSIGSLLSLWEGWCVFPQSSQEHFVQVFEKPPLTEKEKLEEQKRAEAEKSASVFGNKGKSRWRTVEEDNNAAADTSNFENYSQGEKMDVDGDGVPLADDEDIDGEPMDDIDGVPMEDSDMEDVDGQPLDEGAIDEGEPPDAELGISSSASGEKAASKAPQNQSAEPEPQLAPRRRRPKAEDMFADSDSN